MASRVPLQHDSAYGNENYFQSQFDKQLSIHEKPFGSIKEESESEIYYSPEKKRQNFRFYQNTKTQQCKQILGQIQNLKVPKEILQNKNRFYKEEYMKFQEVEFKEFKEFDDMLNNETKVTIEYYFEERSKFHRELNETKEKFTNAALELADIIQRRFPFIDVIIKNLKECEEIKEFHPYGLFEIQIITKQGAKTGILYSKKISFILPSPNKIIEEIYLFVDKVDIEVEVYDILESSQVITANGLNDKKLENNPFEGIEVILRQKVYDYQVNREGNFVLYGLNKPTSNKNEILSHTLGSSKSILYTRASELENSNINISGELSAHSKQNPVKTFMTKAVTNSQGIVKFKDIVIDVDNYEIEVCPTSFFCKERKSISLKQLAQEHSLNISVGLRPKNISQVNINLYDGLDPLSEAIIKISNSEFKPEVDDDEDEDQYDMNDKNLNTWSCIIRENEEVPGNYSFLAEPGFYYIQILAKGYTTQYHQINIQKGESILEFQMIKKVLAKVVLLAVDMFTMKPLEGVELLVYDQNHQLISSGFTDDIGQSVRKVELASKIKIHTKKDNYIDLFQEYTVNTTAITDKLVIKMISKDKNNKNNFEIIASFSEELFNVTLQAICPDQTIINEKNPSSSSFNVKYDEVVIGKNAVSMISYQPKSNSNKHLEDINWEFDIVMTLRNQTDSNALKSLKFTANNQDLSLPIDQSALQSSSILRKTNPRLSATSLFLSNRVSSHNSSIHSFRGSYSSIRNSDSRIGEPQTKSVKVLEDAKNIVDLNNCLRVYIVYQNVLQDVLYCCLKNLGNKIWRIGTIQTVDNSFIKINRPKMKNVLQAVEKTPYAQQAKKDPLNSTIKSKYSQSNYGDTSNNFLQLKNHSNQSTQKIQKGNR